MNALVINVGGQHVKILLHGAGGSSKVQIRADDDSSADG